MITPETLLDAYCAGYFPMAESRQSGTLYWYNPDYRGIIPLDGFHVPRSLKKRLKQQPYAVCFNTAFSTVITACADYPHHKQKGEAGTWINDEIIALYTELHRRGYAFSVECFDDEGFAGGLYGVSIGAAFFGESMVSLKPDASRIALVHLVERLKECGFQLLDTQFVNDHLMQFGAQEIPREDYLPLLAAALSASPNPSSRFLTLSPISPCK